MFSFADPGAALAFRACFDGEVIELSEVSRLCFWTPSETGMCNLYNLTTNQEAIRQLSRASGLPGTACAGL